MNARTLYLLEVTLAVAAAVILVLLTGHLADLSPETATLWPARR